MGRGENDQGVSFQGAETALKLIVDDNCTTLRTLKAIGLYILNGQIKKQRFERGYLKYFSSRGVAGKWDEQILSIPGFGLPGSWWDGFLLKKEEKGRSWSPSLWLSIQIRENYDL